MIFIDTSFTIKNKTGVGVYVITLMKCLNRLNKDYKMLNFSMPDKIKFKYIWYNLWLNTVVYFKTLIEKPDVFISPAFVMPSIKRKNTKYVTVIHDLCALRQGEMGKYSAYIFNRSTEKTLKKADIIVTVSKTVKQELIAQYKVSTGKIKVIHNAIAPYFINLEDKTEILSKYGIEDKKYILSVATLNKRKNIPELIKAFESISDKYPDIKLVLVGGMGNEQREKLTTNPNIIFTGYIQDEEIPVLYKHAIIYVSPSLYEGFGSIIMEAQYSGTPLLCSDIPVYREVAGYGAEFCETDSESIAKKMEYLINNPQKREELIGKGSENVKRFDIERVAQQLKEAIDS